MVYCVVTFISDRDKIVKQFADYLRREMYSEPRKLLSHTRCAISLNQDLQNRCNAVRATAVPVWPNICLDWLTLDRGHDSGSGETLLGSGDLRTWPTQAAGLVSGGRCGGNPPAQGRAEGPTAHKVYECGERNAVARLIQG